MFACVHRKLKKNKNPIGLKPGGLGWGFSFRATRRGRPPVGRGAALQLASPKPSVGRALNP